MIKRIKRALAGFLRDELLEYIGYKHNWASRHEVMVAQVPFEVLRMERTIPVNFMYDMPTVSFEQLLDQAKKEFAREVMENIKVDTRELTSDRFFNQRSITLSLMVQKKQS